MTIYSFLKSRKIRYIIVGGRAMSRFVDRPTSDDDVMVMLEQKERAFGLLEHSREVHDIYRQKRMMDGVVDGVRFDILSPESFCAARPEDFYLLIEKKFSIKEGDETVAAPPAVWFMRLISDEWRKQLFKIQEDAGYVSSRAVNAWLHDVQSIANFCGLTHTMEDRIEVVRKLL